LPFGVKSCRLRDWTQSASTDFLSLRTFTTEMTCLQLSSLCPPCRSAVQNLDRWNYFTVCEGHAWPHPHPTPTFRLHCVHRCPSAVTKVTSMLRAWQVPSWKYAVRAPVQRFQRHRGRSFRHNMVPWGRVHENLIDAQLVNKMSAFYGTTAFIAVFTTAHH
jgi:hypothetical protein